MSKTIQLITLFVAGFLGVAGVLLFAGFVPSKEELSFGGEVVVWGTTEQSQGLDAFWSRFNESHKQSYGVTYKSFRPDIFEATLLDALASGTGPDVIILPSSFTLKHLNKITEIPYQSYPRRSFEDSFVDGAGIFLTNSGILSVPLFIDPLVMYWNKDLYNSAGIARVPRVWGEFLTVSEQITKSDQNANISKSALALGTFSNIKYAKEILVALIKQVGGEIVLAKEDGGRTDYLSALASFSEPISSVIKFYIQFSDPAKSTYSWNVSLPNSETAFSNGLLATYFSKASNLGSIKRSNPHLNFSVATLPQRDLSTTRATFGDIYGLSVLKNSKNQSTAFRFIFDLSADSQAVKELSDILFLPPARRDLLAEGNLDTAMSIFYDSAIIATSFLDPSYSDTNSIFASMINSVISGRASESKAISTAQIELNNLLR